MTPKQQSRWFGMWKKVLASQGADKLPALQRTKLRCTFTEQVLGELKSWADCTNDELDALWNAMELSLDPDNIAARIAADNPELGRRRRLEFAIGQLAPEPYRLAVMRGKFATTDLDQLSVQQLIQLRNTLAARKANRPKTPVGRVPTPTAPQPA